MHVADGVLSPQVCAAAGVISLGVVGYSLRRLRESLADRLVPLTGMTAALIFAAQMVNFPIGLPVSGHLLGGVLAGVLLGPWAGCLAITIVLSIQCALFGDGGITALGVNILHMAVIGAVGGSAIYQAVRRFLGGGKTGIVVGAVTASWLSVMAAAAAFCVEFRLSWPAADHFDFSRIFALMILFHALIGIGEAIITGSVIVFVLRHRPDLIASPERDVPAVAGCGRSLTAVMVSALAIAALLSPFASTLPDGLEAVAQATAFDRLQVAPLVSVLDGYRLPIPFVDGRSAALWSNLSISLAGLLGTGCVLAASILLGRSCRFSMRDLRFSPLWKLACPLGVVLVSLSVPVRIWPVQTILLLLVVVAHSLARVPLVGTVRRLAVFLPMLCLSALSLPASQGFQSGWEIAISICVRSTLAFLSALWLIHVMPFCDWTVVLRRLRIPNVFVAALGFTHRYLSLLGTERQRMHNARRARSFGTGCLRFRWRVSARLIGMLLIRALERAERIHAAMCARGWSGEVCPLNDSEDSRDHTV